MKKLIISGLMVAISFGIIHGAQQQLYPRIPRRSHSNPDLTPLGQLQTAIKINDAISASFIYCQDFYGKPNQQTALGEMAKIRDQKMQTAIIHFCSQDKNNSDALSTLSQAWPHQQVSITKALAAYVMQERRPVNSAVLRSQAFKYYFNGLRAPEVRAALSLVAGVGAAALVWKATGKIPKLH